MSDLELLVVLLYFAALFLLLAIGTVFRGMSEMAGRQLQSKSGDDVIFSSQFKPVANEQPPDSRPEPPNVDGGPPAAGNPQRPGPDETLSTGGLSVAKIAEVEQPSGRVEFTDRLRDEHPRRSDPSKSPDRPDIPARIPGRPPARKQRP